MSKTLFLISAMAAAAALADGEDPQTPEVSEVTMVQTSDRMVTISYTLAKAPAIVTLDIETNGVSIGGANIDCLAGDVCRLIAEDGRHQMTWRPDVSWPNHKCDCRAVVTAWAPDSPPDYMVVDLKAGPGAGSLRFYPAAEFLPGGLAANDEYRNALLVMRKISAKNKTFTMGSTVESGRNASREKAYSVTMPDDYYIGVFEVTQAQWMLMGKDNPSRFTNPDCKMFRPVDNVGYTEVRSHGSYANAYIDTAYDYPNDPHPNSFLGKLRTQTGLLFDLPSECQWEYACRAGNGERLWGDGSYMSGSSPDAQLSRIARYAGTSALVSAYDTAEIAAADYTKGTAKVGSYAPNSWGLYDMHGNVVEFCLDMEVADRTSYGAAVVRGETDNHQRIVRGGSYTAAANDCRSAIRGSAWGVRGIYLGLRVACPVPSF